MKSYLSLIPISAKVRKRQNCMTLLCIVFAVFLVTAVFSMADMGVKMEQTRLLEKHGSLTLQDLLTNTMTQTLFLAAGVLFVLILTAAVLMISSSMNSNITQRTKFFGMMRCLGMSRQQIIRFVRLEALNWCKPQALRLELQSHGACALPCVFLSVKNSPASLYSASVCPELSAESLWVSLQYYSPQELPQNGLQKYLLSQQFQAIHKMMVMHTTQ